MIEPVLATGESVPFFDLVSLHYELEDRLVAAFRRALRTAVFVGGAEVANFEAEFASSIGVRACVGVSSGTDALRFAYLAMRTRPGDEVVTVPNTFVATTEALTQAGAAIRFVDVDPETYTMDPRALEAAITPRTVGVVPVHLYGQPADMDAVLAVATKHGLWVIEDAAQAHGAEYKGRHVGTMGVLAGFSFYPAKNLGALGEAGATVGSDAVLVETVRQLRDHGQSRKYYHEIEGYNGRLDAIQAAFLRIKLPHLPAWNEQRRHAAGLYRDALGGIAEIQLPVEAPYAKHVYHLFVIQAERRDALRAYLAHRGIETGLHYPVPLHLQNAYRHLGLASGAFPVAERAAGRIVSLPMFPGLTEAQIGMVADAIRSFYRG